jgi:uncharacterized protein (TIGR04255 family)
MHLGAILSANGFGRFERLIPPQFPLPPGQVACRFRPTKPDVQAPLFQLGSGVFTANALPPHYSSWKEFCPTVRMGLESLFGAFAAASLDAPAINSVLVRYIDAFKDELTGGRHTSAFLAEVMGVRLDLPDAIARLVPLEQQVQPAIQLEIPTSIGKLSLAFGHGSHGSQEAVLMDASILIQRSIGQSIDLAISAMTEGREVIHELFRGLTASLHEAMEPK